jgi:hypothetical protein
MIKLSEILKDEMNNLCKLHIVHPNKVYDIIKALNISYSDDIDEFIKKQIEIDKNTLKLLNIENNSTILETTIASLIFYKHKLK